MPFGDIPTRRKAKKRYLRKKAKETAKRSFNYVRDMVKGGKVKTVEKIPTLDVPEAPASTTKVKES